MTARLALRAPARTPRPSPTVEATPTQAVRLDQRARARRRKRGPRALLLGLVGIAAFLLLWEAVTRLGLVNPAYLPPATVVFAALARLAGFGAYWLAIGQTLLSWSIGIAIAAAVAVPLGMLIGLSPFLKKFTQTTIEFLRPIPSVGLIPLAVLLFGIKIESTLMLVIYASFWQILIQVLYGVADTDAVAMNTAKSYSFNLWQRIRDVVLPTALPSIMTGLRLAAAVGLILAITAELIIGSPGLGTQIARTQQSGVYENMYALILTTGFLGVLINTGVRWLERRTLSWHESVRGEAVS